MRNRTFTSCALLPLTLACGSAFAQTRGPGSTTPFQESSITTPTETPSDRQPEPITLWKESLQQSSITTPTGTPSDAQPEPITPWKEPLQQSSITTPTPTALQ